MKADSEFSRHVRRGDLDAVRHALEAPGGAALEEKSGQFWCTPLLEACRFRQARVATLLLDAGARVDACGGGRYTALHCACDGPADGAGTELVVLLLERGADADAVDHFGRTPLHFACKTGAFESALVLLQGGAGIDGRDADGATPLHFAAAQGGRQLVAALLGCGADVAATDIRRETPLHYATRFRRASAANLLIRAGADPDARSAWGELAGTLAKAYKIFPTSDDTLAGGGRTITIQNGGAVAPVCVGNGAGNDGGSDGAARTAGGSRLGDKAIVGGGGSSGGSQDWWAACPDCSGRYGRHYTWCRPETLASLPESAIIQ